MRVVASTVKCQTMSYLLCVDDFVRIGGAKDELDVTLWVWHLSWEIVYYPARTWSRTTALLDRRLVHLESGTWGRCGELGREGFASLMSLGKCFKGLLCLLEDGREIGWVNGVPDNQVNIEGLALHLG